MNFDHFSFFQEIFGKKSGKKTGKKSGKKTGNKTGKIPQEAAKKKVYSSSGKLIALWEGFDRHLIFPQILDSIL